MKTKAVIENDFKETEIGLVPEDWKTVKLGDVAEISSGGSAPQGDNYFNGKNPFIRVQHIEREGDRVIKWDLITDDAVKKYKLKIYPKGTIVFPKSGASIYLEKRAMLPLDAYIVSHLCAVISNNKNVNQKFLFYELRNIKLSKDKADGYPTLNLSEVKNVKVIIPSLLEQQKIAFVLLKIQQAIEQQDRIIEKTRELKKSLMNKLFTEGLHGEEQKETEIGLMPKSWGVERVAEVYNFTKKQNKFDIKQHKKIPFIPMEYISEQQRIVDKYDLKEKISSGTFVLKGDLIVAKITPSFENGKQGIVDNIPFEFVYATTEVWPIHNREGESNINFLHYYLKKPDIRNEIAGKMEGSTGRQRVPKNVLENLKIPFPRYVEQGEISGIFISLDVKISQVESKKQTLQDLFKTMLNQLMTGKIRVKDLDFEVN